MTHDWRADAPLRDVTVAQPTQYESAEPVDMLTLPGTDRRDGSPVQTREGQCKHRKERKATDILQRTYTVRGFLFLPGHSIARKRVI